MKFQKEICIKNGKNMRARTRAHWHTHTRALIHWHTLTATRMRHMLHLSASMRIDLDVGVDGGV